jgi:hypothetical protein
VCERERERETAALALTAGPAVRELGRAVVVRVGVAARVEQAALLQEVGKRWAGGGQKLGRRWAEGGQEVGGRARERESARERERERERERAAAHPGSFRAASRQLLGSSRQLLFGQTTLLIVQKTHLGRAARCDIRAAQGGERTQASDRAQARGAHAECEGEGHVGAAAASGQGRQGIRRRWREGASSSRTQPEGSVRPRSQPTAAILSETPCQVPRAAHLPDADSCLSI